MFKYLAFLIVMLFSSPAFAHGSSHPSCNGIYKERNEVAYTECKLAKAKAYQAREYACLISKPCMEERAKQEFILKVLLITFFCFIGLLLILLFREL